LAVSRHLRCRETLKSSFGDRCQQHSAGQIRHLTNGTGNIKLALISKERLLGMMSIDSRYACIHYSMAMMRNLADFYAPERRQPVL
jgi:hypothetical protein